MIGVESIRWIDLPTHSDDRGALTAVESNQDVPFEIKRVFFVHSTKVDRGGHAHRDTTQLIVAPYGSLRVEVFDGQLTKTFELNSPTKGILVPPMIFVELCQFSPGAVCMALADTHYDITRSIRTREEFLKERAI